jgi:hypothetical protein
MWMSCGWTGAIAALVGHHLLEIRHLHVRQEGAEAGTELGSKEVDVGAQLADALHLGELLLKTCTLY